MRSDSDSEDGELGGLFGAPDDSEYEFYFVDISIAGLVSALGPSTEVSFHFRYHTGRDICSKMIIDGELTESARPYLISIGMCILPWYWMGFATKAIIVEVDGMTDGMISFFSSLYENVLLEFCERNGVSFPLLRGGTSRPTPAAKPATEHISAHAMEDTVLIPLGGGKDSLVSLDMALDSGNHTHLLYVIDDASFYETDWRIRQIVSLLGASTPFHLVRHTFASSVFDTTRRSYLTITGHPWAALVIFDALLVARLNGVGKVFFGFEKSADFGNLTYWNGKEINHQYDKSSDFLRLVRAYVNDVIHSDVQITSPLSDLWDIEVAKVFCEKPELVKFHNCFLSCNESHGTHTWCRKCEKCAFVFLVMSAFLEPPLVQKIFDSCNMLDEPELCAVFLSLVGGAVGGTKPYECIGTFSESSAAVELSVRQWRKYVSAIQLQNTSEPHDLPVVLGALARFIGLDSGSMTHASDDSSDSTAIILKWTSKDNGEKLSLNTTI